MANIQPPDWATKLHIRHHSNPHGVPWDQKVFDYCVKRPQLEKAWNTVKLFDDEEKKLEAFKIINLYTEKSAAMAAGICVQELADAIILHDDQEKYKEAKDKFISYRPVEYDLSDTLKHDHYQTIIDDVASNAIDGLREAGQALRLNKWEGEKEYLVDLPGCALQYIGRVDYASGNIELKTVWPSINKRAVDPKNNFTKKSLPARPSQAWLGQVAGYSFANKKPPTIVVANQSGYKIFNSENCSELSDQYMDQVMNTTIIKCKTRERLMRAANGSVEDFFGMIEPDFSDWRWKTKNPELVEIAKRVWGLHE